MIGPVIDEVRMIRPCPDSLSAGSAACTAKNVPFRFVAKHLVEVGRGHLGQVRRREDAGVAAHHVQAAVPLDRRRDHRRAARRVADIAWDVDDLAAGRVSCRRGGQLAAARSPLARPGR